MACRRRSQKQRGCLLRTARCCLARTSTLTSWLHMKNVKEKRVGFSGIHCGPLKLMLGYTAAETSVQWCCIPCHAGQMRLFYMTIQCLSCESASICGPCHDRDHLCLSGLFVLMTMQLSRQKFYAAACASCGSKTGLLQRSGSCELIVLPCPSLQTACSHVNIVLQLPGRFPVL